MFKLFVIPFDCCFLFCAPCTSSSLFSGRLLTKYNSNFDTAAITKYRIIEADARYVPVVYYLFKRRVKM